MDAHQLGCFLALRLRPGCGHTNWSAAASALVSSIVDATVECIGPAWRLGSLPSLQPQWLLMGPLDCLMLCWLPSPRWMKSLRLLWLPATLWLLGCFHRLGRNSSDALPMSFNIIVWMIGSGTLWLPDGAAWLGPNFLCSLRLAWQYSLAAGPRAAATTM